MLEFSLRNALTRWISLGRTDIFITFMGLFVFSLCPSVSHSIFHRAILTYFVPCCYCELDDFAIVFPNSVCTCMHLFMIIHKHIQAVEFLFSLIFCFVHVCMCVHVYFVFLLHRHVTCWEEIFFLSTDCASPLLHVFLYWLQNINMHTYMCTNRNIWILDMEMSCLYVSVTYLLLFLKFLF